MVKIRNLPDEIVVYIFSFLKLRERKIVSRVSRLFNHLAFADMGTVSMHVIEHLKPKESKILLKSNRKYRHLILEWTEKSSVEYFLDVLNKFGKDLVSLKLYTYKVTPNILLTLLLRTPKLKELTFEGRLDIDDCEIDDFAQQSFESLRSLEFNQSSLEPELVQLIPKLFPKLTSLDFAAAGNTELELISIYGKQLKKLSVLLDDEQFRKFSQLDCLEGIIEIDVCWPLQTNTEALNCLLQMHFVRSATFTGILDEQSFDIICSNLKHLEHLSISLYMMEAECFRKIASLNKLKKLTLQRVENDHFSLEGIQLSTVSHLFLDGISSSLEFYKYLPGFVPNVSYLKIYDYNLRDIHLCYLMKNMPRLRVLLLDYCYQLSSSGFKYLHCLTGLLELRLWSVNITERAFFRFPLCPHLRTFIIGGSARIAEKIVLSIPRKFPNLKELRIVDCPSIDDETIYTLQEMLKKCAIVKLDKLDENKEEEVTYHQHS
ncbi:uncharacterized protein LOC129767738 [Toxorhynchites rutilus septentrionalis]|uniref:uncharacterized protein LOC129767738 n=1 Tax=Toxorhynchites rutilus septentrionalis TaxID=329112 RepID=UPI00247A3317|nr:uncharacterized protein LOC129767738 [Toxorhynchites rutilus septentrionalis]